MYVSDGYGNRRVAKFDAKGKFLLDWGTEGEEPGQFALPHGLITDNKGQVYVADRENWRVQIFDPDGRFVTQWAHVGRIFDLVQGTDRLFYTCDGTTGRVTQVDASGEVLGFFGEPGEGVGQLSTAHDIDYSPNSDIVVGHLDGRVHKFSRR
jgi:DNA-binding beta-propeller fold protein YncE